MTNREYALNKLLTIIELQKGINALNELKERIQDEKKRIEESTKFWAKD